MIQFVEMECPNCSGPLTKTGDNTAKCSHCGAEFLIDHDQPERITHVPPSPAPQNNNRSGILSVVTVFLLIAIGTICFIAPGHTGSEVLLEDNSSIADYSALSKLGNLETLTLELGYDKTMPSVENWRNLTSLSVSSVGNINFLTSLPKLQSLCISGCSSSDYTALSSLKNLERLKLRGIYGDFSNPDVLSGMKKLKSLDIGSVTIYGNVEFIFGIPGLENLNIDDCSFGLDFAAMPKTGNRDF